MPCISIPTAMLIAGGVSAVAGVGSAVIGAGAAKDAAATQAASAREAQAATEKLQAQTREDLSPYMTAGEAAIPTYLNLLGINADGTTASSGTALSTLEQTPGYQFTLQQGLKSTQSGYAAQGLASSGAALKGAAEYSTGLAQNTYQDVLANYYNALGSGQSAATATGQISAGLQSDVSSLITGAGAAEASGTVGAANAITSGISTATSGITNALLMNSILKSDTGTGLYGTGK